MLATLGLCLVAAVPALDSQGAPDPHAARRRGAVEASTPPTSKSKSKSKSKSAKSKAAASKKRAVARPVTPSASEARRGAPKKAASKPSRRRASSGSAGSRRGRAKGKRRVESTSAASHARAPTLALLTTPIVCPADMVAVAGRVCVDRYETSLVDDATGAPWSPYYTPDVARAQHTFELYRALEARSPLVGLELPLPVPPSFVVRPRALSVRGATPQGYLSADQAARACEVAGKRLCTEPEWVTACKGEEQSEFPYGERYEQGTCNVFRETHPSVVLHRNASRYHDDPRNPLVSFAGRPLLETTGSSPRCASHWGEDAVMDMVGNLDEWVDDPDGVFVGGFYSRGTRSGCFARVSAHVRAYSDYSTGARCCKDPG